ncbi:RidA family protein [Neptunomonas sp.]|uniref:RidA family protein n=1 Tax=Neptunomonas sp. TaxID=1971898 RepID=UPI00356130A3
MTINFIKPSTRMSTMVKHNNTVYLCGQVADDYNLNISEQTRQCLANIDALLTEVGSDRDQILTVTIYIRDMKDFDAMNIVWDTWVAESQKPARVCVEARMASPEILVEFSVIAAVS